MEKERKIGEVFQTPSGKLAKCVERSGLCNCTDCILIEEECSSFRCMAKERKDQIDVCFPLASIEEITLIS